MLWAIVAIGLLAVAACFLVIILSGAGLPELPAGTPRPCEDEASALTALNAWLAEDGPEVAGACRTRLAQPDAAAKGTIVFWHGFTNCPAQLAEVAELLRADGYNVLVPRIPRHGITPILNDELKDATAEEIVDAMHRAVDIAAGLPGPLWVAGLSVGAAMASLAAATRTEVRRLVCCAPFVQPKGIPIPVGRVLVRLGRAVPTTWVWWDPRRKAGFSQSAHVYPGFPLRGLVPFLHIGLALHDGRVEPSHELERVVLTSNPGDFAIRLDAARHMIARVFGRHAEVVCELTLAKSLGWWHDFIDQHGRHHGTPEQVAGLLLAAFGASDDPPDGVVAATTDLSGRSAR